MKNLLLFGALALCLTSYGQSKKRQIAALNYSIDSLNVLLSTTRNKASRDNGRLNKTIIELNTTIEDFAINLAELENTNLKAKRENRRLKKEKQTILAKERKALLQYCFKEKNIHIDSSFFYKESMDFIEGFKYLVELNSLRGISCTKEVNISQFKLGDSLTMISRGWIREDGTEDESCESVSHFVFHDIEGSPNKLVGVQTRYTGGSGNDYTFKPFYYVSENKSFRAINFDKPYKCSTLKLDDLLRYKIWPHQFENGILTIAMGCCRDEDRFGCYDCCPDTRAFIKYRITGSEATFIGESPSEQF